MTILNPDPGPSPGKESKLDATHLWITHLWTWLALIGAAALPAQGQFDDSPFGGAGGSEVEVRLEAQRGGVAPGDQIAIAVVFEHEPGWHINPHEPVVPPELEGWTPTPTLISVEAPAQVEIGTVQWPETHEAGVDYLGTGKPVYITVYDGTAVAYVPIRVSANASPGDTLNLVFNVSYGACNDSRCLAPEEVTLTVDLPVVAASELAAVPTAPAELFANFDPATFAVEPPTETYEPGEEDDDGYWDVDLAAFNWHLRIPSGPVGLSILLLVGAFGGFLLNLTPCVLPVIPIKVMALTQASSDRRKALFHSFAMFCGVVVFWLGVGFPVALLKTFNGPSQLFSIWWITLLLGLFIAVMGLGLMGMFTVQLPQSVYKVNPKLDSAKGSFVFGIMTAVLGMPCFAPLMAGVTAFATRLNPNFVILMFAAIGVGMALPYLVLSLFPKLVERVPRTGPASELVKQVMGLLLVAASAYFIGSGLIALVSDYPYLAKNLHWWTVAIIAGFTGLWLIIRTFQITKRPIPRVVFSLLALMVGAGATVWALNSTATARLTYEEQLADREGAGDGEYVAWDTYTPARFESARQAGQIVILDFTAEWCLICKTLKATVLSKEPVRTAVREQDVIALTVDLTSRKSPGWEKLAELGEIGIPLLVVYTPGSEEPWKSNAYTPQQVLDALSSAREAVGSVGVDQEAVAATGSGPAD